MPARALLPGCATNTAAADSWQKLSYYPPVRMAWS